MRVSQIWAVWPGSDLRSRRTKTFWYLKIKWTENRSRLVQICVCGDHSNYNGCRNVHINIQGNFAYSSDVFEVKIQDTRNIFFLERRLQSSEWAAETVMMRGPLSDIRLGSIKKLENWEAFSKWPGRVGSLMKLWTNTHLASRGAILPFHDWQRHKPGAGADKLWIFTQFNGNPEKDIGLWLVELDHVI